MPKIAIFCSNFPCVFVIQLTAFDPHKYKADFRVFDQSFLFILIPCENANDYTRFTHADDFRCVTEKQSIQS